ncbi:2Fe-2S ferredoxin-type domain-containing protein [Armillaria mellea]|nr:2Fe-2S ferredoxin-type domain-containing protein [Armillaria mellea]
MLRGLALDFLSVSSRRPFYFKACPRRDSFAATWNTRGFHRSIPARHGGIDRPKPGTGYVGVTLLLYLSDALIASSIVIDFKDSKGTLIKTVEANEGDDILSIAHEYDIDLEGACEGSIACSTCHVILEQEVFDQLEEPGDDENDMLDMAFGLTETSRLGCQVKVTKDIQDGRWEVRLPAATRNMFVDGKKASH